MAGSSNRTEKAPAIRAWMVGGVVVSLVIGVLLGYALKPEKDTSEIEQRVDVLEQELQDVQEKASMIETSLTGGEPLEELMCGMYLNISGMPGDCNDTAHKGWIEIVSYSHGMSMQSDVVAPEHEEFSISKLIDKSSPKLAEALCSGTVFKEVVLEVVSKDGTTMTYTLENAIITGVRIHSPLMGESYTHMEEVSFTYDKIEWVCFTPGSGDMPSETVTGGWDLVKNEPT